MPKTLEVIGCPCCGSPFFSDRPMPFTKEEKAVYAAAPDLLAACREAVAAFDRADKEARPLAQNWADLRAAAEVARAAIASATGDTRRVTE